MFNMQVEYKGIIHNVLNDAPFIAALIIAKGCNKGCKSCFNEHLKKESALRATVDEIIATVKRNGLNQGVIFAGLEWSEQPKELIALVKKALEEKLEVIVYTHHYEKEFFKLLPELEEMPIYIKFGEYDETKKTEANIQFGVKLATSNQYIKKVVEE